MLMTSLLVELFNTNFIQRWNDKLRPVNLTELDYQAHRMMIAYFLGKYEEKQTGFRWVDVIEGAIFSLLETSVLTDLKWNVKDKLKKSTKRREKYNEYVFQRLEPLLFNLDEGLLQRFKRYQNSSGAKNLNRKILLAAAAHAREWEFRLLENANPEG